MHSNTETSVQYTCCTSRLSQFFRRSFNIFFSKGEFGRDIEAVEFMDKGAFEAGLKMTGGENVLGSEHDFYVLLETSGSCESHDREKVTNFLDHWMCNTTDSEANGVLAQDETQLKNIWSIRESVGPSCSQEGLVTPRRRSTYNYPSQKLKTSNRYDISLPLEKMYDVVSIVRSSLTRHKYNSCRGIRTSRDSNLHLNVVVPDHDENVLGILEPFVFDWTTKHSEATSAEHVLGNAKYI